MKIELNANQYESVLFLAQLQLIEFEKSQGSLIPKSQELYSIIENELLRLNPNRNCMIVNK